MHGQTLVPSFPSEIATFLGDGQGEGFRKKHRVAKPSHSVKIALSPIMRSTSMKREASGTAKSEVCPLKERRAAVTYDRPTAFQRFSR